MSKTLRIGTRESPLALWQAHTVRDRLMAQEGAPHIEIVGITTEGDRILDQPLARFGGKGLFLKELESALVDQRVDIAVHSMKDVTVTMPPGLDIPVVLESADPRDAFVSSHVQSFAALPVGARVGTSSLRRRSQVLYARPDLKVLGLRGNVNTRLAKLDAGDYDAIILAAAGLDRLAMQDRIRERIAPEISLPAVGQGIVGVQCRADDAWTRALLAPLNCELAMVRINAERALNKGLDGGCHMPLAGFAEIDEDRLRLRARLGMPDGTTMLEAVDECDHVEDAADLGERVAEALRAQGADEIIATVSAAADFK